MAIAVVLLVLVFSIFSAASAAKMKSKSDSASGGKWAKLHIIDIHAHIGSFRGFAIGEDFLVKNIDSYGIEMALASNIDGAELPGTTANLNEVKANKATTDFVRAHPRRTRGLIWTRPEDGSSTVVEQFFKERLHDPKESPIFVGMKFHPDMNHFAADDRRVDAYLKLCEKFNVPAVFHCGQSGSNSDPERIYNVAKRHPRVSIILYHMGFGGNHQSAIDVAARAIRNRDAQLFVETSQANPEAVLQAIKQVGADRVLFGTDATYFGANHYASYQELVEKLTGQLAEPELKKVLSMNAKRLFHL